MVERAEEIRVLGEADFGAFMDLTDLDPVVNVFAAYRARMTRLDPRYLGGEIWGRFVGGELVAGMHACVNLVPIQCTIDDLRAFAPVYAARRRATGTVVGPRDTVVEMWQLLAGEWRSPRERRWHQPHMEIASDPLIEPDPDVRVTRLIDFATLYPACVAMYTEELGVSPELGPSGREQYQARVHQLVQRGWSFARFDDDGVVFKAEVACLSAHAAQVQGVWVRPDQRGRGVGKRGMAQVVSLVRRDLAPVVSLYVNDWNTAARVAYEQVGFTQTGEFATLLW